MKALISLCAHGQKQGKRLAVLDVKRAYFYAPARREIYIHIPIEDRMPGDKERVGILDFSLYGTRDAAQNWAKEVEKFLVGIGFRQGKASPCNYYHPIKDLSLIHI